MKGIYWALFFWVAPIWALIVLYLTVLKWISILILKMVVVVAEELFSIVKYLVNMMQEYRR
jgi:hypothetical protein